MGASAGGGGEESALVEGGRKGGAHDRCEPLWSGDRADDRTVDASELELHGDGAAGLEDARLDPDLVCGVVDWLQESAEHVRDRVVDVPGGGVAGEVGRGRRCS